MVTRFGVLVYCVYFFCFKARLIVPPQHIARGMGLLTGTGKRKDRNRQNGGKQEMVHKKLDLTGTFSPYCLTVAGKEAKALKPSDELIITCDDFPAVTTCLSVLRPRGYEPAGQASNK